MSSRFRVCPFELCEKRVVLYGSGTVLVPTSILEDTFTLGAEFADIDGDGDADVVVGVGSDLAREIVWFENSGGDFSTPPRLVAGESLETRGSGDVRIDDVDGDGDLDVIVSTIYGYDAYDQSTYWFENLDGNGTFSDPQFVVDESYLAVRVADLDGDLDIVFATNTSRGRQVTILECRVVGDANDDGSFDASDLVAVFPADAYDRDDRRATFDEGVFLNGDGQFDSADLVFAFQEGTYFESAD